VDALHLTRARDLNPKDNDMSNASSKANVLWFLPTHGDGRYLGTSQGGREVNFN